MEKGLCFVCGSKNNTGLKLKFEVDSEKQQAACSTAVTEDYQGWEGIVHGGIIASIIDGSMVYACKSIGLSCVTAELNIRYKKAVPLNKPIHIIATVKNRTRWMSYHVIYTEAVVKMDGKIAVRAKAKMFVDQKDQEKSDAVRQM